LILWYPFYKQESPEGAWGALAPYWNKGENTMIKIKKVSVMILEYAVRGARNPIDSWAKSDSAYDEKGN
jgi:hypothetical protein